MLAKSNQKGFSLIELLLVVVIVGLLSTIAIPSMMRALDAAESASAVGTLHTMRASQALYYFRHGRYGRLNEINSAVGDTLGTTSGTVIKKGNYTYYGFPTSDNSLKTSFTIISVRFRYNVPISAYLMRQDGVIQTLI